MIILNLKVPKIVLGVFWTFLDVSSCFWCGGYIWMFWLFLWDSGSFSVYMNIFKSLFLDFVSKFWKFRNYENICFAIFVKKNGPELSLPPSPSWRQQKSHARGKQIGTNMLLMVFYDFLFKKSKKHYQRFWKGVLS